jgi:hypothetical protein
MSIVPLPLSVVCPFCEGTSLSSETKGFISKTTSYHRASCGSELETKDNRSFTVIKVGEEYSNTATFMQGRKLSLDKLREPNLPIQPDDELADIANATGEVFEQLLAEANQNVPIVLKKNERAILALTTASLLEERSRPVPGGLGSFSFRVTKGVWYHTGRLSQPQYASVLTPLDKGALILTNMRYVFVGQARSIDQSLSKIISLRPFNDGMGIARTNKQKLEYYQGPYHWPVMASIFLGVLKRFAGQQC